MDIIKSYSASTHDYYDNSVTVTEYNGDETANDAEITMRVRYPEKNFAVNTRSTVVIAVTSGSGEFTVKGNEACVIEQGDRIVLKPDEPYFFQPLGELAIRYTAFPAWTPEQAGNIE